MDKDIKDLSLCPISHHYCCFLFPVHIVCMGLLWSWGTQSSSRRLKPIPFLKIPLSCLTLISGLRIRGTEGLLQRMSNTRVRPT
jgi:hypothetical protein